MTARRDEYEWLVVTSDDPFWHNKWGLPRSFICLPVPARYRRFRDVELNSNDSNTIFYVGWPVAADFSLAMRASRAAIMECSIELSGFLSGVSKLDSEGKTLRVLGCYGIKSVRKEYYIYMSFL